MNPLQILLERKLSNEFMNGNQSNNAVANNSSGASTQGSSIRDFKSTLKSRKFQQD